MYIGLSINLIQYSTQSLLLSTTHRRMSHHAVNGYIEKMIRLFQVQVAMMPSTDTIWPHNLSKRQANSCFGISVFITDAIRMSFRSSAQKICHLDICQNFDPLAFSFLPMKTSTTAASGFPSASCTRGRPNYTRRSLPRVQHSGKSLRLIL
jgi:hypothetical protein